MRHKRMAKAKLYHAQSVEECLRIARTEARAYQRQANAATGVYHHALCTAARNAADRIALKIRFGRVLRAE